jgi:hypothetical protein
MRRLSFIIAACLAAWVPGPVAATDLPLHGGAGGGSFRTGCGAQGFLVGIDGRTGDWIDAIRAVCVRTVRAWPAGDRAGASGRPSQQPARAVRAERRIAAVPLGDHEFPTAGHHSTTRAGRHLRRSDDRRQHWPDPTARLLPGDGLGLRQAGSRRLLPAVALTGTLHCDCCGDMPVNAQFQP